MSSREAETQGDATAADPAPIGWQVRHGIIASKDGGVMPHSMRLVLAVAASLSILAGPTRAAQPEPGRETWSVYIHAESTDWTPTSGPGPYKSLSITARDGTEPDPSQGLACIELREWTHAGGTSVNERKLSGCSPIESLVVAGSRLSGHLVATITIEDCRVYDPLSNTWGGCVLGTVVTDLTARPAHAIRQSREVELTGTVTLGDRSLITHPWTKVDLWRSWGPRD